MILGTLGSNKAITTTDAIMTEIFTGLKPNEIRIYREEENKYKEFSAKLESILKLLGINAKVKEIVIGDSFSAWKEKMSSKTIDVLDVTPARKYMAYIAASYSKASEIRYAYLKKESEGYRVFGYVPLQEIKVINMRDGSQISYSPPLTQGGELVSRLDYEGLTAFYNLLSLHGKVEIEIGGDVLDFKEPQDDYVEKCLTRAGYKVFEEEKIVEELANQGYNFLADTNTYINLGLRLDSITRKRLLASKSVYNELSYKTKDTQKIGDAIIFDLGMYTYTKIHKTPPITSDYKHGGDIPLINEARILKENVLDQIAIITADEKLANRAQSQKVKSVLLSRKKPSEQGNIGELLFCLGYRSHYMAKEDLIKTDVKLLIEGKEVATIRPYILHEGLVDVQVKNPKLNYAKLVEELQRMIPRSAYY